MELIKKLRIKFAINAMIIAAVFLLIMFNFSRCRDGVHTVSTYYHLRLNNTNRVAYKKINITLQK